MTEPDFTTHSDDRRWWWDGHWWLPAFSWDGRWWFDGQAWTRTRRRPLARPVVVAGMCWLAVLSVPAALAFVGGQSTGWVSIPRSSYPWLMASSVLAVLVTGILGFVLGRHASWTAVPAAALVGTGVLGAWYAAAAFASAAPTDTSVDDATGAGLAILGGPTWLGLVVLIAVGTAIARLTGLGRRRSGGGALGSSPA